MTQSPGAGFTAKERFDKVFEVGILLKGLDGLLEIAGGVLLLLIKPEYLAIFDAGSPSQVVCLP